MKTNQNDPRGQQSGNKSTPQSKQDYSKKETNPDNPTAKQGEKGQQSSGKPNSKSADSKSGTQATKKGNM